MPTTQELKDIKAAEIAALEVQRAADIAAQEEKQALIDELADLIHDSEQIDNAETALAGVKIKSMNVIQFPPTGEAMTANLTAENGAKFKFDSKIDSNDMIATMIAAGMASARSAIEDRKIEIQDKLDGNV